MATLFEFTVRDAATIRQDALITYRYGLRQIGIANPDVSPLSEPYVRFTAFANEAEIAEANGEVLVNEVMPDSATGARLEAWGMPYGIHKRPAGGSVGPVVLDSSASTAIVTGAELKDTLGQRYAVTVGGIYDDGDPVPVKALSVGVATNLDEGTSLQWVSAPAYSKATALVGLGGLRNGVNADDDETYRSRLFEHWRNPPASGNQQDVVEVAEADALPMVQKAFVYAAPQGPGTTHLAVTAAPTLTNKNRDVFATTMSAVVVPYILGQMPSRSYYVITTVANVQTSLAIALAIPDALTASPPGPGGGWLDGTPWPIAGAAGNGCVVTAVTSSVQFTVDATTPPAVAASRISWLSPSTWTLYSAVVIAVSGSAGAYTITVDQPFTDISTGCLIFPSSENAQAYVDAIVDFFKLMGPGEKSLNSSVLVRGYRHPQPRSSWPSGLGPAMLSALKAKNADVTDALFVSRYDGYVFTLGNAGDIVPRTPNDIDGPPNQFVPQHIGFYRS